MKKSILLLLCASLFLLAKSQESEFSKKIKSDPIWQAIQDNQADYLKQFDLAWKFVKLRDLKLPSTWNTKKDFVTQLKEAGFVNAEQIEANMKRSRELYRMLHRKYPELIKQRFQSSLFLLK